MPIHNKSAHDKIPKIINVGFLYPVINGIIYVGQRGTEPQKGLYGPIGGKSETHNPSDKPYVKESPAIPHIPRTDLAVKEQNKEYGHVSALREFYEEAFQIELINDEISDVFKIGSISDEHNGIATNCQFYLAKIDREDFNLSPRELHDMKPLQEVSVGELFPMAKLSLFALKKVLEKGVIKKLENYRDANIKNQIPDFDKVEIIKMLKGKTTTMRHGEFE
jgi:hypothetical protein